MAIGRNFSYGLLANGKLMSVGNNSAGLLAIGTTDDKNNWVNANSVNDNRDLVELSNVIDIAVDLNFVYALKDHGTLWSVKNR